jgi:hypothetical protein
VRIVSSFVASLVLIGACVSPEQYGPVDGPGPAVATVPRDATTSHDVAADAALAWDVPGPDSPGSDPVDAPLEAGTTPDLAPDVPAGPPPTVVRIPETSAPARLPEGTKVTCLAGPNVLASADCPVVQWLGYSYWTLSYRDNRSAATLVGYDPSGRIVKELTFDNVRYIWNIEVDDVRRELVFHFQDSRIVAVRWDDLRVP